MNEQRVSRATLTFAAAINTLVYAIIVFIIGVTLPTLSEKFALSDSQKGTLFLVQNMAILVTILGIGPLMDRFGRKQVLVLGALLVGAGVVGIGIAPTYSLLLAALFLLGIGGGCNNIGGSTLISDLYPENPGQALNLITSAFGAGAIGIPLLGSFMIGPLGLLPFVLLLGSISFVPFFAFSFSRFPAPQQTDKFVLRDMFKVIGHPLVFFIGMVLFFYVALEISTAGWMKDYFIKQFALTDRSSGFILTGFSAMFMVGRVAAGLVLKRLKGVTFMIWCAMAAIVGLSLMILSGSLALSVFGVLIVGLAYAPIFPTSLGMVGENFSSYLATRLGTVTALGTLGAMLLPWFIGRIGGNLNVMIVCALLLLLFQNLVRIAIRTGK